MKIYSALAIGAVLVLALNLRKQTSPEKIRFLAAAKFYPNNQALKPVPQGSQSISKPGLDNPTKTSTENEKIDISVELEAARKDLSQETLVWSELLPRPKNKFENVFHFFIQVARENDEQSKKLILDRASDFLKLDDSFSEFVAANLEALDSGRDQNVKNFIYSFARAARPNFTFAEHLTVDLIEATKSPHQFSDANLQELKSLIWTSPGFTINEKLSLFEKAE